MKQTTVVLRFIYKKDIIISKISLEHLEHEGSGIFAFCKKVELILIINSRSILVSKICLNIVKTILGLLVF